MVNNTIQISIKSKEHDFQTKCDTFKTHLFHGDNGFSQKAPIKTDFLTIIPLRAWKVMERIQTGLKYTL